MSFKLKLVRGSGEFHESIDVETEFGGHRAPNSPEPKPSGPVKADSLKKGQRYWVAFASPYEHYPAYPQGVIALWPEDDAKAAKVLDEAVKADHWKWRPQFHPKLGLTIGRLIEADKKQWKVRVWKGDKMLWEATIPGAQPAADRDYTPDWGFFDIADTTSQYPAERPKSGHILMSATLRPLAADNEFSLPAKTYLVKSAYDPETGICRASWVYAESPPGSNSSVAITTPKADCCAKSDSIGWRPVARQSGRKPRIGSAASTALSIQPPARRLPRTDFGGRTRNRATSAGSKSGRSSQVRIAARRFIWKWK